MQIIFSQADVKAFKTTIINIARDARNMPLPTEAREIVRRIVTETEAFGPAEVAELQKQFDLAHLRIETLHDCSISISLSTEALKAQLGLIEEVSEFALDIAALAMPAIRLLKKFTARIAASNAKANAMLFAKFAPATPDNEEINLEELSRHVRRGEKATDWSAA